MRVLVTGGAGYIGSHTVVHLVAAGHDVVVADSFANAKPAVMDRLATLTGRELPLYAVDLTDRDKAEAIFAGQQIDAVVHFAGLKAVGESVQQPLHYYENNLDSTFAVLRAMRRHGCHLLVFSSSATVYGSAAPLPYREDHQPLVSASPYGRTKVMLEHVLHDVATVDPDLQVAILRYFNPVGAHPSGQIGEDPQGIPNNLMPFVAQVAVGRRDRLQVFGGDYATADGTAERDYIHVEDLAAGHVAALNYLAAQRGSSGEAGPTGNHEGPPGSRVHTWNLGSGVPRSVLQVVRAFEQACGRPIPFEIVARRPGDLPASWADPAKAAAELGWRTTRTLEQMCADTWRWQQGNPAGYPG
jgi:UDP-glucose 4-epimerase